MDSELFPLSFGGIAGQDRRLRTEAVILREDDIVQHGHPGSKGFEAFLHPCMSNILGALTMESLHIGQRKEMPSISTGAYSIMMSERRTGRAGFRSAITARRRTVPVDRVDEQDDFDGWIGLDHSSVKSLKGNNLVRLFVIQHGEVFEFEAGDGLARFTRDHDVELDSSLWRHFGHRISRIGPKTAIEHWFLLRLYGRRFRPNCVRLSTGKLDPFEGRQTKG
jgi:hypothetical protein